MTPHNPGIYKMLDKNNAVLYVGKAKNLYHRLSNYTRLDVLPNRTKRMLYELVSIETTITYTEVEALLLEANLIKKYQPPYNILLKDGKSPVYIVLTDHPFPQLIKKRHPNRKKETFFGPFLGNIDETLATLHRFFLLRSCSDNIFRTRKRPCLQYHIKRCSAPCSGKISQNDYHQYVQQALKFLKGEVSTLQKDLALNMQAASHAQDYEKATELRDKIAMLTQIQAKQLIYPSSIENADVLALVQKGRWSCIQLFCFRKGTNLGNEVFFLHHGEEEAPETILSAFMSQFYQSFPPAELILSSATIENKFLLSQAFKQNYSLSVRFESPLRGEKKEILNHALMNATKALDKKILEHFSQKDFLKTLQRTFDLPKTPDRIEIFDNSHLKGNQAICAMVVATPSGLDKKAYLRFNFPLNTEDDYQLTSFAMKKRFYEKTELPLPDLLIIDGGKGHLSTLQKIISPSILDKVSIIAIAKGPARNAGEETLYQIGKAPLSLPKDHPVLHYLQRLRDEAHRFAIESHRKKRNIAATASQLHNISGIGKKRKLGLLQHFGTISSIKNATLSDLCKVSGISKPIAQKIYDFFHPYG